MKFNYFITSLFTIVLLLSSCTVKRAYEQSVKDDTEFSYSSFLSKHPKSKYRSEVVDRLAKIKDEKEWSNAQTVNTITSYQKYVDGQNAGIYRNLAFERLEKLKAKEVEDRIWKEAQRIHSIEAYSNFIATYPSSEHAFEARQRISLLNEHESWKVAQTYNTIDSYHNYLIKYPDGKYAPNGRQKISFLEEEERVRPFWEKALNTNTHTAYKAFSEQYSKSSYADIAIEKMDELDESAWHTALTTNTIDSYNKYLKEFIDGLYEADAKRKIIDIEVDKIFRGEHGKLPPMQKVLGSDAINKTHTSIEIQNDTRYLLTVLYSGTESKKIEISPGKKTSIRLKIGKYRIAASVKAANVSNYVGTEDLDGHDYGITYYIESRRAFK